MAKAPSEIAGTSESSHQQAVVSWARVLGFKSENPQLRSIYAVPNGGKRDKREASRLKSEGVSAGVPDLVLPAVVRDLQTGIILKPGLYIEMKKPGTEKLKTGGLKPEQMEWRDYLMSQGYHHAVCYTWKEAASVIAIYLDIPLEL